MTMATPATMSSSEAEVDEETGLPCVFRSSCSTKRRVDDATDVSLAGIP